MDTNEIIYKTEVESHVENKLMVTRGNDGGGIIERLRMTFTHDFI